MVAKRMGSQGGGSNSAGRTQAQTQDSKSNPLAREGSLYSLTLDEVQNHLGEFLGKPLTSMNIDELLKTVSTAAANNQVIGGGDYATASQPAPGQPGSGSSLNRQSSVTLTRDLSQKTVDEVWQDIQQGQKMSSLDRKTTFGEMTLEDFLVRAGVVVESLAGKGNSGSVLGGVDPMVMSQQAPWMNYQIPTSVHSQPQQQQSMLPVFMPQGHPVPQAISLSGNPIMDVGHPENQTNALMGTLSDIQTPGRKRVASGEIVEKSVERRQKRMIKNRESAARSRARKQAYTHELENKVSRLEEENERLKKQKEWEKALPSIPPPEPKRQLRRTSSAPI